MREYQNMKQSMAAEDPLSREISLFKAKREQADMIENIFRTIKNNYNSTDINVMKNNLDRKLSQQRPAYNQVPAANFFNRIRNEVSNKAFQGPEFVDGSIINDFKVEEVQRLPVQVVASPPVQRIVMQGGVPIQTTTVPTQHVIITGQPAPVAVVPSPVVIPVDPGRVTQQGRLTPSRVDRPPPVLVEPAAMNAVALPAGPKSVSFDPSMGQPVRPGTPGRNVGQVVQGRQPMARVSPDKSEVQVNYKVNQPRLTHLKNINLSHLSAVPMTIKSLDDRNLAVGFADGSLKIMDIQASNVAKQFKFASKVKSLEAIDDDGRVKLQTGVLVGLGHPDNAIALLDLGRNDVPVGKYRGHTDEVSSIVNIGGGEFISAGYDGNLMFWNTESQSPVSYIQAHAAKINSMATLNNHTVVITGGDDRMMKVFGVHRGEFTLKHALNQGSPVMLVSSFYGNSRFAFSCQLDGSIRIWNVEGGE
jgi:hypothetical protein